MPPNSPHHIQSFHLTDAASVLAAIPSTFGFTPEHSMVVLAMNGHGKIVLTVRYDLDESSPKFLDHIGSVVGYNSSQFAVSIAAYGTPSNGGTDRAKKAQQALRALTQALERHGVVTVQEFLTQEIATGKAFWSARDETAGIIADTASIDMRFAQVTRGMRQYQNRSQLEATLAVCSDLPIIEPIPNPISLIHNGRALTRQHAQELVSLVNQWCSTRALTDEELGKLAHLISLGHIRDVATSYAVSDRAVLVAELWRVLATRTRGRSRSTSATLYAQIMYVLSQSVTAGIALQIAREADHANRLADLLSQMLNVGMDPHGVTRVAIIAYYAAVRDFNVPLPPMADTKNTG